MISSLLGGLGMARGEMPCSIDLCMLSGLGVDVMTYFTENTKKLHARKGTTGDNKVFVLILFMK